MKQKYCLLNKNTIILFSSVLVSFMFVALISYAATTISTNINTGGTLTVTGASTLTGAVWASSTLQTTGIVTLYNDLNVDSGTLFIDSTNNRLGVGSTTPAIELSVAGDGYLTGGLGLGARNAVDSTLVINGLTSDPAGKEGMFYYNSSSKVLRLYDGSNWFTVGTTTSGLTLSGNRLQLADLNYYTTFGTTTQQGLSMLTVEATSTVGIPLTLVARASQTANTFQIRNAGSANLLYVDSAGGLFGSSTGQFTGNLTTYGSDTLGDATADTLTVNSGVIAHGNKSTTTIPNTAVTAWSIATSTSIVPTFTVSTVSSPAGRVGIGTVAPNTTLETVGTASSTNLIVGGDGTNGNISGVVFGFCTITGAAITASSTRAFDCANANGVRTGDKVFVQATSSLGTNFVVGSASSSAANTISLYIMNTGYPSGNSNNPGNVSLNFMGIR